MPPFSSRTWTRTRGSPALGALEHLAARAAAASSRRPGTAPSRRSVWVADRLQHRREHVGRGVVDRREDREAGRRHPASPAGPGACAGGAADPHAHRGSATGPGATHVQQPRELRFERRQLAARGAQFGVLADQQVAQAQDLLVAAGELGLQLRRRPQAARRGGLLSHWRRVYPPSPRRSGGGDRSPTSANLSPMAGGQLLWMLAVHLVLTALPGVAAALLAARRGVRSVPVLLAIALAASGGGGDARLLGLLRGPGAGRIALLLPAVGSVAADRWALYGGQLDARCCGSWRRRWRSGCSAPPSSSSSASSTAAPTSRSAIAGDPLHPGRCRPTTTSPTSSPNGSSTTATTARRRSSRRMAGQRPAAAAGRLRALAAAVLSATTRTALRGARRRSCSSSGSSASGRCCVAAAGRPGDPGAGDGRPCCSATSRSSTASSSGRRCCRRRCCSPPRRWS